MPGINAELSALSWLEPEWNNGLLIIPVIENPLLTGPYHLLVRL